MKRFAIPTSVVLALATGGAALAANDTVLPQPIQLAQTSQSGSSGSGAATSGTSTESEASQPAAEPLNTDTELKSDRSGTTSGNSPSDVSKPSTAGTQMDNMLHQKRADEIIGKDVVNDRGDEVGTIEDLVLDQEDKVVYAIVSAGGFLGIGDKKVAVDFKELSLVGENEIHISDSAATQLRDAPEYDGSLGYQPVPRDRPVMPNTGTQQTQ